MKLVFCIKCRFVYMHPGDAPSKNGPKNLMPQCLQCFDTGGGGLHDVPAEVVAGLVAPAVTAQVKTELLRRQYTAAPTTFPIATTPPEPKTEDECRPA